jgi:hypothetical protein
MPLSSTSTTTRAGRITLALLLALIAWSTAFASARAAERPLTDADIERWLPRLRAEAAAFTKSVREARETSSVIASRAAEQEKLYADIESGKTDPLAWLRAHTRHAVVPDRAVYNAACSRAITMEGVPVTAVFTFNMESPYRDLLRRAAAGDAAAVDEFNTRRGEEEIGERSAEAQATRKFITGILLFYYNRGFVDAQVLDRPVTVNFLVSPDSSVAVTIWEENAYSGLLPRNIIRTCSALPTGPLIEITYEVKRGVDEAGGAAAAQAGAGEAGAGSTAGEKSDPDYERVKEALFLARMDAANPSALEFEIPADAPAEAKAELAALAAEFAVRKANVIVYKRHEAELAPVFKALFQLSE